MSFVNIVIFRINLSGRENLTDQAGVLGEADAGESVVSVLTEATVETRIGITLVDFLRAIFASISGPASALEVVDSILAGSSIGTRGVLAVVVVVLTVATDETILADALVIIDEWEANALILTGVCFAQICHFFAISPLESWGAGTGIAGHVGHASGSVFTWIVFSTNIKVRAELAMRSMKSWGASAGIIVVEPSLALPAVPAGKLVALVDDLELAVPAGEADGTGASVVLAGVEAGGPVVTRPVVGAEVEVLVAHLTSPALRALAGPWLGAGAVDTAGVDLAVVAELSLPAFVALAFSGLGAVTIGGGTSRSADRFQTVIITC